MKMLILMKEISHLQWKTLSDPRQTRESVNFFICDWRNVIVIRIHDFSILGAVLSTLLQAPQFSLLNSKLMFQITTNVWINALSNCFSASLLNCTRMRMWRFACGKPPSAFLLWEVVVNGTSQWEQAGCALRASCSLECVTCWRILNIWNVTLNRSIEIGTQKHGIWWIVFLLSVLWSGVTVGSASSGWL